MKAQAGYSQRNPHNVKNTLPIICSGIDNTLFLLAQPVTLYFTGAGTR